MCRKFGARFLALLLMLIMSGADLFAQSRIRFRPGATSASVSGRLAPGARRVFVLGARYGQPLSATVSSRNSCVAFSNGETSLNYTTGSGNNFIYLNNNCGNGTSYRMTVSIPVY